MLVEFSDFVKFPRFFYRLIGFLPFIDGTPSNTEQTLIFTLGSLDLILAIVLEIGYLIQAIKVSFLEATGLAPCIGFCILGVFKNYIVWSNRRQLRSLMRDLKDLFPVDEESQRSFNAEDFLKRTHIIVKSYLFLVFTGITVFTSYPLSVSLYEYFLKGMFLLYELQAFYFKPLCRNGLSVSAPVLDVVSIGNQHFLQIFSSTSAPISF